MDGEGSLAWTRVAIWARITQPGISQERGPRSPPSTRCSPRPARRGPRLRREEQSQAAVLCLCHAMPPARLRHPPGSDLEKVSRSSRFLGEEPGVSRPERHPPGPAAGPHVRPPDHRSPPCQKAVLAPMDKSIRTPKETPWLPLQGSVGQQSERRAASPELMMIEHDREPIYRMKPSPVPPAPGECPPLPGSRSWLMAACRSEKKGDTWSRG